MRNLVGLALAVVWMGCGGKGSTPPGDAMDDRRQTVVVLPATPTRDLDLLFVIDDSVSMADKQVNLANNFPNFINRLAMIPGGLPDLHLGVVTTDMGTKGSGSPNPGPAVGGIGQGGCGGTGKGGALQVNGAPVTGPFLSDVRQTDGTRIRNYTGTLAEAFSTMARVGATGCGFEQPLAAMRAALDNHPANAGFLRPDALLAVVFLADEDDCSVKDPALFAASEAELGPLQSFRCTRFGVTCAVGGETPDAMNQAGTKEQCAANPSSTLIDDVAPYRDFLAGLKSDARKVIVSGILGNPEPFATELRMPPGSSTASPALAHSCTYAVADPPARLTSFLDMFPNRSTFSTICQPDLSGGLVQIAQLVVVALGSPCVDATLADVDPSVPGVQPDCVVEDVVGQAVMPIAPCDPSETPTCWKLDVNPVACTGFDNLELVIVRDAAPDPKTVTRMRCIIES